MTKDSDLYIPDDISSAPELMRGQEISKKAVSLGFVWNDVSGIYDKINEELDEVKSAKSQSERELEIGDVLFSVLNLARHYDIDAETALNKTNDKFIKRFNNMMKLFKADNPDLKPPFDVDLMEKYWIIAKKDD